MADFVDQSDVLKVLIVVDVQNCFMNNVFAAENEDNLNLGDLKESFDMAEEIASMTKNKDLVVFTRDLHPINHISLNDEGREIDHLNVWPQHCRNPNLICDSRIGDNSKKINKPSNPITLTEILAKQFDEEKNNYLNSKFTNLDNNLKKVKIKGNELSYFFYSTNIKNTVHELNAGGEIGAYKIGSTKSKKERIFNELGEPEKITKDEVFEIVDINGVESYEDPLTKTEYITLTKGEQCNKESYSAFNYHLSYKFDETVEDFPKKIKTEDFVSIDKKNSTGLWEWILKNRQDKKKNDIVITVCGLVGNVCVMHTVLQGLAMWENIYKIGNVDVKFQLSLKGTRFTSPLSPLPPRSIKPFLDEKEGEEVLNTDYFFTKKGDVSLKDVSYYDWFKINKPKELNPEKDVFEYFTFLDYKGNEIPTPKKPESTQGGSKRTRKNKRNCSMNMRHKSNCKCRMCGGKKRTTKNRRITKRRRH
jgi:nicotinamidase-related amidase